METLPNILNISAAISSPSLTKFTTHSLTGEQLLSKLYDIASQVAHFSNKLPGSSIVKRYVVSSHQNDPIRTILELFFLLFAFHYFVSSRYSTSNPNYVKLSEEDINELVKEWEPESLIPTLGDLEKLDLQSIPEIQGESGIEVKVANFHAHSSHAINCASTDFLGWSRDFRVKKRSIEVIRQYGVGSCGPPGFYGNQDIHVQCEKDLARFLNSESAILYAQAFNTMSSVIPSFLKRGDIVVADDLVNISIQKGLQVSRVTLRWYKHNDMKDLEKVLAKTNREFHKGPLTKRFIVTEGLFENCGDIVDLPRIIDLKYKYKYRLLLDEGLSIGTLGSTGRGVLEYFQELGNDHISRENIDLTAGNMAVTFGSAGGFVVGSTAAIEHQRIGSNAVTFSASMPGYLAATSSLAISILEEDSNQVMRLAHNIFALRSTLEQNLESRHLLNTIVQFKSSPNAPYILLKICNSSITECLDSFVKTEALLQNIVDTCLNNNVFITRHKRIPTHEIIMLESMLRITVSAALTDIAIKHVASILAYSIEKHAKQLPDN